MEKNETKNDQPKSKMARIENEEETGIETILEKYHPPANFDFPRKKMGQGIHEQGRSCQHQWFQKWNWLHYDLARNSLFCYICNKAYQQKLFLQKTYEKTFISGKGFSDWKKATEKINKHEKSDCHIEATSKICETTTVKDIGTVMSSEYRKITEENRKFLVIIIDCLRYLARQGLPTRSHENDIDSNFHQLLQLEASMIPGFAKWLQKKTCKYTSHRVENQLLEIMALKILRGVVKQIRRSNFYTIMADETCDVANIEQLVFCIRYIAVLDLEHFFNSKLVY